jgi:serpin B
MIQRDEFLWSSMESLDSTMVELPYNTTGCHNIVMQILLPDDKDGLDEVEEKLGKTSLQEVFEKTCRETDVEIQLPKFKLEKTITLNKLLASLGMTDMFNDEADFTGITDKKGLFVSLVLQKNLIDVDEEGSVTATVTAVEMVTCPAPSPPAKQFTVDHPFIFYLRDKTTKMLLFMGRVTNPLQEA